MFIVVQYVSNGNELNGTAVIDGGPKVLRGEELPRLTVYGNVPKSAESKECFNANTQTRVAMSTGDETPVWAMTYGHIPLNELSRTFANIPASVATWLGSLGRWQQILRGKQPVNGFFVWPTVTIADHPGTKFTDASWAECRLTDDYLFVRLYRPEQSEDYKKLRVIHHGDREEVYDLVGGQVVLPRDSVDNIDLLAVSDRLGYWRTVNINAPPVHVTRQVILTPVTTPAPVEKELTADVLQAMADTMAANVWRAILLRTTPEERAAAVWQGPKLRVKFDISSSPGGEEFRVSVEVLNGTEIRPELVALSATDRIGPRQWRANFYAKRTSVVLCLGDLEAIETVTITYRDVDGLLHSEAIGLIPVGMNIDKFLPAPTGGLITS